MTNAPWHRWFAWHPVRTRYHGWRWLRNVYRRQLWTPYAINGHDKIAYWEYDLNPTTYISNASIHYVRAIDSLDLSKGFSMHLKGVDDGRNT